MSSNRVLSIRPAAILIITVTAVACLSAVTVASAAASDAQRRYQRDSAMCMKLRTDLGRPDCLSEASTRLAGTMPSRADEAPEILARNALRRCAPLAEPDRSDCVARIQGLGTTSGSVAAGGIYRELVTRTVGEVPTTPPPQ